MLTERVTKSVSGSRNKTPSQMTNSISERQSSIMRSKYTGSLTPGLGDGCLGVGFTVKRVKEILGEPTSISPTVSEFDSEIHSTTYLCYPALGLDVEIDCQINPTGNPNESSRVRSLQYDASCLINRESVQLDRKTILSEYGKSNETGRFSIRAPKKIGTWEFYDIGFQADYDEKMKLKKLIICSAVV